MKQTQMYTQEQLEIELLKNSQGHIFKILERLENRFDKLDQKVDSHFHWTLGLIFGMYAMGITGLIAAIGHSYNLF